MDKVCEIIQIPIGNNRNIFLCFEQTGKDWVCMMSSETLNDVKEILKEVKNGKQK